MPSYQAAISIKMQDLSLLGNLTIPEGAVGIVIFSHGSGSSRLSPRNNYVAKVLQDHGLATLLLDLLTAEEDLVYENRFNINLLAKRLIAATHWVKNQEHTKALAMGYFGASTGAASALRASAFLGSDIQAVVSRGGRPDLAMAVLSRVEAPTLFIVGGWDREVVALNQQAFSELRGDHQLVIVPEASHLFEEPGKLEEVATLSTAWFKEYLT
ncbi:Alpha/beta hydrolase family protein [Arenibacter nanhaiticus]|uniref:Alpha/beta hydrolase family protein n=1 Tax=Arenibacter nanhaiticus TaxID=558155 RepID=A0A1M6JAQ9_9FLAO|nr:dienelactone hydrolase family protein [Arenibacter nanhaiticus]SHJ43777.1 Alpha/beta hydrolase family protein [Arenibacter nanhaiticus]